MVDVKLCERCDYSAEFLDTVCCDYIGIVHRARPKSGAGQCTVFTPKTDRPRAVNPYAETDITYGECEPWHKESKCPTNLTDAPNVRMA